MAILLTEADSLFVHVPKTGGHWVEKAIESTGIAFTRPKPLNKVCPRHARRSDVAEVKHAWCVRRNLDDWLWSYWRFALPIDPSHWRDGNVHYHEQFGPPISLWDDFNGPVNRRRASRFFSDYEDEVDETVSFTHLSRELPALLRRLGYTHIRDDAFATVPRENVTKVRLEFGGGTRRYDDGAMPRFCNVDVTPNANINWDLNQFPYPFPDDVADEIYSSHCLEHLEDPQRTLKEFARIAKLGAKVVVKVPHPNSEMAMVATHRSVISPQQIENLDVHFPEILWSGRSKRLKLQRCRLNPSAGLDVAKQKLKFLHGVPDQAIMQFIAGTVHESVFTFEVTRCKIP
jgi:hypothetical protein